MNGPDDGVRIIPAFSIQQAFADEHVDFRFTQQDHEAAKPNAPTLSMPHGPPGT
jgi:hypothetical protein